MALRQVFVSTDADLQAASAPDYFLTDLSSGVVGIWESCRCYRHRCMAHYCPLPNTAD